MAPDVRHIIRKATLEVDAGNVDAFRFQQEAVTWAQDRLLRELDGFFAALPDDGVHRILERVEVEVEASDPSGWEEDVLPKLRAGLASALAGAGGRGKNGHAEGEERLEPAAGFLRKLTHYLEHGTLPWNLVAESRAALIEQAEGWLSAQTGTGMAPGLASAWKSPAARIRFLGTFPASFVSRLLIRVFRMPEALAAAWARDAARLAPSPEFPGPLPGPIPPSAVIASGGTAFLPGLLLHEILIALSHDPRLFEHGLEEEIAFAFLGRAMAATSAETAPPLQAIRFESEAFRASRDRWLRGMPRVRSDFSATRDSPAGREPPASGPFASGTGNPPPESAPGPNRDPKRRRSHPAEEGIFIPNAGLILLSPFFGMLFERLDLIADPVAPASTDRTHAADEAPSDDEASSEARTRQEGRPPKRIRDPGAAAALLHYLATGRENPAEFEIPLAKLLCGIRLEDTVSIPECLDDRFKSEAGTLLASAAGHWTALKGTSPEGLREAFLQRSGKLTRRPRGGWLLQVEQKAYDMLLQHLPWSFQLTRLPWMDQMIRAEWVE